MLSKLMGFGAAAVLSAALAGASAVSAGIGEDTPRRAPAGVQVAQGADVKAAFDAAKELGTLEAWEAFLTSFPNGGFYVELARAYVRKLAEPAGGAAATSAGTPPPPPAPPVAVAVIPPPPPMLGDRACAELATLRAAAAPPARVTFVNNTGVPRSIVWIDFAGQRQPYNVLAPGASYVQETNIVQPWLVTDAAGTCFAIYVPGAPVRTIALIDPNGPFVPATTASAPPKPDVKTVKPVVKEVKPVVKSQPKVTVKKVCEEGYYISNGKCVRLGQGAVQGCPPGTVPVPETDNCVKPSNTIKVDKNGFEVEPWKKPQCPSLQAQCSAGNGNACANYEATCQVN